MTRIHGSAAFLGLSALVWVACSSDAPFVDRDVEPATTAEQSRPARPIRLQSSRVRGYKGPLPPVPSSPYAAASPSVVQSVYEFAARRPDVLRYVPCFCGCERNGHKGNEDCFVASRDADGRPTWEAHGLT